MTPTSRFPADVIAAATASHRTWDILASISLAQWALESGWGRSMPAGSNNPFGIKATHGQPAITSKTREFLHGRYVTLQAPFRQFTSLTDAFNAHAQLLATAKPYERARDVKHDAHAFANALTGVYATDPHYGRSLISLIDQYKLTQYDQA